MGIEQKRLERYTEALAAIVLTTLVFGGLGALWLMT